MYLMQPMIEPKRLVLVWPRRPSSWAQLSPGENQHFQECAFNASYSSSNLELMVLFQFQESAVKASDSSQ